MTAVLGALLAAWLVPLPAAASAAPLEAGLQAYREARYDDAARLLAPALAAAPDYDGFVTLGLAHGRLQHYAEARAAFDRAVALDPRRPQAWIERGGLAFLEQDYARAVADLRRALVLAPGDAYVTDLLASSLHLAGRGEAALAAWNTLDQPRLGRIHVNGIEHTRPPVARRELTLAPGETLALGELQRTRLRLVELGIFDRVTLRAVPLGDGQADLDVALVERHGFFASRADLVAGSAVNALQGRARLRYSNVGGAGLSLGAEYRWQRHRPELSLGGQWPRPFGLPVTLRLEGFRGRQLYDVGGEVEMRRRGLELVLRHVAAPRTVLQLSLQGRGRNFSHPRADAPAGAVVGAELGLEQRLADAHRVQLDAGARLFRAFPGLGSDLGFTRAVATLAGRVFLAPPEGTSIERSLVAARLRVGRGSRATPLDELFAPGGSPEMELPLRAHRQLRDGIVGATPVGRSLALVNVEWRRRVYATAALQAGMVVFYDAARVAGRPDGAPVTLHDAGLGLRLALRGASTLRVDFGKSLSDGRSAVFIGLGQTF